MKDRSTWTGEVYEDKVAEKPGKFICKTVYDNLYQAYNEQLDEIGELKRDIDFYKKFAESAHKECNEAADLLREECACKGEKYTINGNFWFNKYCDATQELKLAHEVADDLEEANAKLEDENAKLKAEVEELRASIVTVCPAGEDRSFNTYKEPGTVVVKCGPFTQHVPKSIIDELALLLDDVKPSPRGLDSGIAIREMKRFSKKAEDWVPSLDVAFSKYLKEKYSGLPEVAFEFPAWQPMTLPDDSEIPIAYVIGKGPVYESPQKRTGHATITAVDEPKEGPLSEHELDVKARLMYGLPAPREEQQDAIECRYGGYAISNITSLGGPSAVKIIDHPCPKCGGPTEEIDTGFKFSLGRRCRECEP